MADSGAIRAGRAFVEAFLDDSKLDKGLQKVVAKIKAFGQSISAVGIKVAALGAAIEAPLTGATLSYTETASALGKMSQRTGIAVEELSALQYAASRSGLSAEQLELSLKKMQKTLFAAGQGGHEARRALAAAGVPMSQLKDLTPDQQLMALADAFASIDDPTKKAGLAMQIFGKSGTDLIPFLNKGAAGIADLKREAAALGVVLTAEDVAAAKEFKSVMAQLKAALQGVAMAIGSAILPAMTRTRNIILPLVQQVTAFVRENKRLFDALDNVAIAITAGGIALVVFGKLVSLAGSGLGVFWKILKLGVAGVMLGFKIFAAAFYALFSPMGLAIAAVVVAVTALAAAFLYLTDQGAKVRATLAAGWGAVLTAVTTTWKGIVDAIMAGDLALAGKIAMAGIKAAWFAGFGELHKGWVNLAASIRSVWSLVSTALQLDWENVVTNMLLLWELAKRKLGQTNDVQLGMNVAQIARDSVSTRNAIGAQHGKDLLGIEKIRQAQLAEIGKDAADAVAELNRLTEEARRRREEREGQLAAAAEETGRKVGNMATGATVGTFNAAAALRIPGFGPEREQEKQTLLLGRIAGATGEMLKEMQQQGKFQ